MQEVVIVAAARTGIGNFCGALSKLPAAELGATVIQALLKHSGIAAADVDGVIMGQVLTAGAGQNPARQALIHAGIPVWVPALSVNQVCGSGLKAVQLAAQAIACGDATIVIAGGQENMSLAPHLLSGAREGWRMGPATLVDSMVYDGLTDYYHQYHMGVTAENIAEKYHIGRAQQDAFAAASQHKAHCANVAGKFRDEIIPVTIPQRKGDPLSFAHDEFIKPDVSTTTLAALRPAFKTEGTVTPGNASGINDGAAAVIVTSASKAAELGLAPLASVATYSCVGVEPALMGMGPVPATQRVLQRAGWSLDEVDLIEANEAFAAQALGVAHELGWDEHKVNVNGGAIALGHPIGASGCRILVTLLHEMRRRGVSKGLATLCIGGGMGIALALERR